MGIYVHQRPAAGRHPGGRVVVEDVDPVGGGVDVEHGVPGRVPGHAVGDRHLTEHLADRAVGAEPVERPARAVLVVRHRPAEEPALAVDAAFRTEALLAPLLAHVTARLPEPARPVFLRLRSALDAFAGGGER